MPVQHALLQQLLADPTQTKPDHATSASSTESLKTLLGSDQLDVYHPQSNHNGNGFYNSNPHNMQELHSNTTDVKPVVTNGTSNMGHHKQATQQQLQQTNTNNNNNNAKVAESMANHPPQSTMGPCTSTKSVNNNAEPAICAGCNSRIVDKFLLEAVGKYWHEDCLRCAACQCRLGEVGSTLFFKQNMLLCRRDYLRLFGLTGVCAACNKNIPAFEMVMRARNNVYHLDCFACQECGHRFCVGDQFYLCENKILCQYDYNERCVFAQMLNNNYNNFAQLKEHINKQVDRVDEMPSSVHAR